MDVSKVIFAFLFKIEKSKALHFRESAILRKVLVCSDSQSSRHRLDPVLIAVSETKLSDKLLSFPL